MVGFVDVGRESGGSGGGHRTRLVLRVDKTVGKSAPRRCRDDARGRWCRDRRLGGGPAPRSVAGRRRTPCRHCRIAGSGRFGCDAGAGETPRVRGSVDRTAGRSRAGLRYPDGRRRRRPMEAGTVGAGCRGWPVRPRHTCLHGERRARRAGRLGVSRLRARRGADRDRRASTRYRSARHGCRRATCIRRVAGDLHRHWRGGRAHRRDGHRPQRQPPGHRGAPHEHLRYELGLVRCVAERRGSLGGCRRPRDARHRDHRGERLSGAALRRNRTVGPTHPVRQSA